MPCYDVLILKKDAKMAEESSENLVPIEPVRAGSVSQNELVYPASVVEALVKNAVKREAAERDAAIRAALDKYTTGIVDEKLKSLEFKLTDDSGNTKKGVNYKGSCSRAELSSKEETAEHGDLWVVNESINGEIVKTAYVWTVDTVIDEGAEEPRYEKHWANFNNLVDLSNYVTKSETWSTEKLTDLEKVVTRNNSMLLEIIAQLYLLTDKNGYGASATIPQLAILQKNILDVLKQCHYRASSVLDEELGEDTIHDD